MAGAGVPPDRLEQALIRQQSVMRLAFGVSLLCDDQDIFGINHG